MREFVYSASAARVVFGAGCIQRLGEEAALLGATRVLVLSTPGQRRLAERAAALLGPRTAAIHDGAVMHVPLASVEIARGIAVKARADCTVAIGGGSTIGLAKALALSGGPPILAVPTTYAGSEMTPIHGITNGGVKVTGKDTRVLPRTVIYDPELGYGLPVPTSVASCLNAIAHCVEGLYARDGNPVMSLMAEEGIRALADGIRRVATGAAERQARADCLYGAWLSGMVLGNVGMALHHKLCHTLGGSFGLPHAETHAVILPHAAAYNAAAAPQAMAVIARALGRPHRPAAQCLAELATELGAPSSLRALGMRDTDLDRAADLAMSAPYWNPQPLERKRLRHLLGAAFEGIGPA